MRPAHLRRRTAQPLDPGLRPFHSPFRRGDAIDAGFMLGGGQKTPLFIHRQRSEGSVFPGNGEDALGPETGKQLDGRGIRGVQRMPRLVPVGSVGVDCFIR